MTWFLIGLIITIGLVAQYYYIYLSPRQYNSWRQLPFLAEYLLKHPECKTDDNESARCFNCQSDKVLFQAILSQQDTRYKHVCLNCKHVLFRIKSTS